MSGFWGGMAQGLAQGEKLVKDYNDVQEEQAQRQRANEAAAIYEKLGLHQPGDVVAADQTPDVAYNDAIASAAPKPGLPQRLYNAVAKGLNVGQAAQAAGVTPPPASPTDVAAVAGLPAQAAPAAGSDTTSGAGGTGLQVGGAGSDQLSPVTVTAPQYRTWTEGDNARLALMGAIKSRDPSAIQNAWSNYSQASQRDSIRELGHAMGPGGGDMNGLAVFMTKHDPHGAGWDVTPVNGADGKPTGTYQFSRDGENFGSPVTAAQAGDWAVQQINGNPEYALGRQITRSNAEAQLLAARADADYKHGMLPIQRAEAQAHVAQAQAYGQRTAAEVQQLQLQTKRLQVQYGFTDDMTNMTTDNNGQGGYGDALLNQGKLLSAASTAALHNPELVVASPLPGPDGRPVMVNKAEQGAQTAISNGLAAYQANPYTSADAPGQPGVKILSIVRNTNPNPQPGEPQMLYHVAGDNMGYTNLNAATLAAQRRYGVLHPPQRNGQPRQPAKK